jgi:hypothetical protein
MGMGMKLFFLISVCTILITFRVQAESVDSLQTKPIISKSAPATDAFLGQAGGAYNLNLPAVQVDLSKQSPGAFKTGVVYQLPTPITVSQLFWGPVNDGYVARIHLVSDQAKRLRFHLVFKQPMPDMAFRVQGNLNASPLTTADQSFVSENNIWLPITIGNTADLEIFVKGGKPRDGLFEIDAINIIVADLKTGVSSKNSEKQSLGDLLINKPQTVGFIQEVEFDLACWNNVGQFPALQIASSATALVSFIKEGGSFVCTGTLLNDRRKSLRPWFITANHCIINQRVASTMAFEWFYQAPTCLSPETDSRYTQTFGGARMLYADKKNDAAFLKLRARPPAGVAYSGWSTNRLHFGKPVWGVHHPEGDHTMVSSGRVTGLNLKVEGPDGSDRNVNEIIYSVGGAEIGSSGSGLFVIAKGRPFWVGGLYGGPANDYQLNYYTNIRNFFSKIQPWLGQRK